MSEITVGENIKFLDSDVPDFNADAAARYAADADRAITELDEAGYGVGAVMIDTSFVNHGIIDVPAGYLKLVVDKVRAAGGVFIADEVQSASAAWAATCGAARPMESRLRSSLWASPSAT